MSQFLGHDFVSFYNHVKCHTENSSNQSNTNKLQSSETAVEEIAAEVPDNISPSVFITKESFISTAYFFPHKLYYSIWLPPDIS